MEYSREKKINVVVKALVKSGRWRVKSTKNHVRLENIETNITMTVPKTPSDHRATQNWLHQLKSCNMERNYIKRVKTTAPVVGGVV